MLRQPDASALESLSNLLSSISEGAITVDAEARITWISDKYRRLLGLGEEARILGRTVESVIPNSQMRRVVESGRPILLDLMEFEQQQLVVTRLPIFDDAGRVVGATGIVLYDKVDYLQPLMSKFAALRSDLDDARNALRVQRQARYSFSQCVGGSAAISATKRRARRAAQTDATVLLLGETGTGKELFAQAIHHASARARRPFIGINLAALPDSLMEAELFGVAPGAYTGAAMRPRQGKFELADGGTLFLDEVGEMPPALQAKLLRVLQEREIEPLGSNQVRRLDLRVIAATSRDLRQAVADGRFRADLYYRLNVLPVELPPLRERLEDLPQLCEVLLDQISVRRRLPPREVSRRGLQRLARYRWPGNVRELQNLLERACALHDQTLLDVAELDGLLPAQGPIDGQDRVCRTLAQAVADAERDSILAALRASGGNRAEAARVLGVSRATLYQRLQRYGLTAPGDADSGAAR